MYGDRIRFYRKQKGLSQLEMSEKFPATYSKIETNRTILAADMLEKIASVLDVSPLAIIKENPVVVNFNDSANNSGTVNSWINPETVFNYQKEMEDQIIAAKDAEIATLKQSLETWQQLIQQQSNIIEKLTKNK